MVTVPSTHMVSPLGPVVQHVQASPNAYTVGPASAAATESASFGAMPEQALTKTNVARAINWTRVFMLNQPFWFGHDPGCS
jgi:hypothetical protein